MSDSHLDVQVGAHTRPAPDTGKGPPMSTHRIVRTLLVAVVVAGLAVDAWAHLSLASEYDLVRSSVVSQGEMFRAEGVAAILAAVLLVLRPRPWTAAVALLVSAAGLAAVLMYFYVDVGAAGPLPNMYEPVWYAKKTQSAWGEAAAAVAALAVLLLMRFARVPVTNLHSPATEEGDRP